MKKETNRIRRGFALIESLVLIMSVAVVVGMVGVLIHRLLELDREDRRGLIAAETVESLARAFRGDVHLAVGVTVPEPAKLAFGIEPGGSVEYRVEAGRVVRTLVRPDKTKHHDVFELPPRVRARFESRGDKSRGKTLAILLDQPEVSDRPASGPYRGFVIEAAPGIDTNTAEAAR